MNILYFNKNYICDVYHYFVSLGSVEKTNEFPFKLHENSELYLADTKIRIRKHWWRAPVPNLIKILSTFSDMTDGWTGSQVD
jgi:hypothetical protein